MVHIRNIPTDVSETEVIHLGIPFGKVTNVLVLKGKNQVRVRLRAAPPALQGRPTAGAAAGGGAGRRWHGRRAPPCGLRPGYVMWLVCVGAGRFGGGEDWDELAWFRIKRFNVARESIRSLLAFAVKARLDLARMRCRGKALLW